MSSFERLTILHPARFSLHLLLACVGACALGLSAVPSRAEPVARIHELAQQEKAPLLDTLRDIVNIESGSKDSEGLAQLAALISERLTRLGGKVVMPKMSPGPNATIALVADPEGHVVGLTQA